MRNRESGTPRCRVVIRGSDVRGGSRGTHTQEILILGNVYDKGNELCGKEVGRIRGRLEDMHMKSWVGHDVHGKRREGDGIVGDVI